MKKEGLQRASKGYPEGVQRVTRGCPEGWLDFGPRYSLDGLLQLTSRRKRV